MTAGMATVYGASTVKRRRTRTELAAVDEAIIAAVETEHPVTLRGVFYRVVSPAGAVEKTEDGYRLTGRELLKLRRAGRRAAAVGMRWCLYLALQSDFSSLQSELRMATGTRPLG